ncbi:MAG: bi-domain-containing oxidoreductase [Bacteroidales bacterium]|nr:bi-domain-containing oxidoreductase [Bacteroidales bacterium]
MEILEVPFPILDEGQVLVRNHYSVISAGTEGKTVTDARKGYIAKARSRQKEVQQVIEMIKIQGLKKTYDTVMNKLEAPSALGYSCAGEVIATGSKIKGFKVGDRVACGGLNAVHADVVAIPENLCVKIPDDVDLKHAAFATIASIAIQGIRQADLRMGENCLIIGMGLIGQITAMLLEASGVHYTGIDVDINQVNQCLKAGLSNVYIRNQAGIVEIIERQTHGYGVDAVIITAGTSSLDPVEFAGEVARKKGKVVIVGAVPTGFSREKYYRKELDLRMSSSYGPGRYDANYEEKGIDYPVGYVRWTENRNMQSFIDMLEHKKIDISNLITHVFDLDKAPEAYQMIVDKSETFGGILIQYETGKELKKEISIHDLKINPLVPGVSFIGTGSFAQNFLLPNLREQCNFIGISTAHGNNAQYIAGKYKFSYATPDTDRIVSDENANTVFIATRHNLHARYVIAALNAKKHVFVEKPLAMNHGELEAVTDAFYRNKDKLLMVGYNRRFAPAVLAIMKLLTREQPKALNIRVNAGQMPADHWVNDPETGGGRIIGEACHFIDLAGFIAGGKILTVSANACIESHNLIDTVTINLNFSNGSIAAIQYFSNGNKRLPKESIEVFCDGVVMQIDDFKKLTVFGKGTKKIKFKNQDKGHKNELHEFMNAIRTGKTCPIPFDEIISGMKATFAVLESVKRGQTIYLTEDEKNQEGIVSP